MKGFVNRALRELVVTNCGQGIWEHVCQIARVNDDKFIPQKSYPDSITWNLVESISAMLGMPTRELLQRFGRHWILDIAAKSSAPDILTFLDDLHSQRALLHRPDLPSFELGSAGNSSVTLRFWSEHAGLAPMVMGMLEGLGEFYGSPVEINLTVPEAGDDGLIVEEFHVEWKAEAIHLVA